MRPLLQARSDRNGPPRAFHWQLETSPRMRAGPPVVRTTLIIALCVSQLGAQTRPDSAKRDTTRITTLAPMRAEATRIERQIFEQAPAVGRISLGVDEIKAAPRFFSEAD